MRRGLVVLLLAAGGLHADGLMYRFRTTIEGVLPRERHGTAWIDGARARVEVAAETGIVASLRDPEAKGCTNLDLDRRTYYAAACDVSLSTAEGLSPVFGKAQTAATGSGPRRSRLRFEEADLGTGGAISGLPTRHLSWTISWEESTRIGPDIVRVAITRALEVWASDRVSQRAFRYGHADELAVVPDEARARLADRLAASGFPLKLVVHATRKFDRGEPTTETLTTVLEDVRAAAVDASLFEIPKDFRHEEPRVGIPTR